MRSENERLLQRVAQIHFSAEPKGTYSPKTAAQTEDLLGAVSYQKGLTRCAQVDFASPSQTLSWAWSLVTDIRDCIRSFCACMVSLSVLSRAVSINIHGSIAFACLDSLRRTAVRQRKLVGPRSCFSYVEPGKCNLRHRDASETAKPLRQQPSLLWLLARLTRESFNIVLPSSHARRMA